MKWITPAQLSSYQRFARNVSAQNELGIRRWRRELRARAATPRYTVVVR